MALQNSFFLCILITILFQNLFFAKGACFQPSGSMHEEEEEENFNGVLRHSGSSIFSVDEFGAKGHGSFDNRAFEKAWKRACSSNGAAVVLVPKHKTYRLKPIKFQGPCKGRVTVQIEGTLEAPPDPSDWDRKAIEGRYWILFSTTRSLAVRGGGTIDGKGEKWWQNSCKINESLPCVAAPTALFFKSCKNLVVENLNVKDSQQIQVNIMRCRNVRVSNLNVSAPDLSPNTDGIHVTSSRNVLIKDSIIGTGDDCISIVSGCRRITARNIVCGPGHGISIGSLGFNQTRANVSNVLVDGAILKGTTNGVRIKTWQGGRGYARRIVFQNIEMQNVKNPIIIDQNYCDSEIPCSQQKNAVAVRNVVYRNIKGTSRSEDAMTLNCSSSVPCQGVLLSNIDLVGAEGVEGNVTGVCENLRWQQIGKVVPRLICA
ncbi:polygalacturonase-like [Zingiber officinale]|uniref:polygalacturonase-like n=1 Tax=Zingiber officinale TaxID=94328 RepID=UPI001C4D5F7D|nr:polygalacturonase-like [Zingiber officinale]